MAPAPLSYRFCVLCGLLVGTCTRSELGLAAILQLWDIIRRCFGSRGLRNDCLRRRLTSLLGPCRYGLLRNLLRFSLLPLDFFQFVEHADPPAKRKRAVRLQHVPRRQARQRNLAKRLRGEQLVDGLVNVPNLEGRGGCRGAIAQLGVVAQHGLQRLVDVGAAAHEPEVGGAEQPNVPARCA